MTFFRATQVRAALPFTLFVVSSLFSTSFAAEDVSASALSRGRATALLAALFYHDSPFVDKAPAFSENGRIEGSIGTLSPRQAMNAVERTKIIEFAQSLINEGGYYPRGIYHLLGYDSPATARVARIARQLDKTGARGGRPSPWEAAGRVGRSGLSGMSDHWAMAAGEDGESLSTPGTLAYLPALAIVYALYPADGREAAAQLAILKDDDLRAAPVAKAAFSLLVGVLMARDHDKDARLREASAESGDFDTEQDVRSLRVKDWRYLRGEECAMGRFERAVHIWYKGTGYSQMMAEGRESLRSRESLAYLAGLAAATYGMESLPRQVIAGGSSDRQFLDLINGLHDLAVSEAVLRVTPEEE